MAKVKGPAFSLGARGAIGKTLIYNVWKGIDYVKEYVVPANPKTEDQKEQRLYFKHVLIWWHVAGWKAIDIKAWNLYASTVGKAMSGFNAFVSLGLKAHRAAKEFNLMTNCVITKTTIALCSVDIDTTLTANVKLYIGTSKTSMYTAHEGTGDGETYTIPLDDPALLPSTVYYFYIIDTTDGAAGRTGIYSFKTPAV